MNLFDRIKDTIPNAGRPDIKWPDEDQDPHNWEQPDCVCEWCGKGITEAEKTHNPITVDNKHFHEPCLKEWVEDKEREFAM